MSAKDPDPAKDMSSFVVTLAIPDGTGAAAMMTSYATALCAAGHTVTIVHGPIPANQRHADSRSSVMLESLRQAGATLVELDGLQSTYRVGVTRRLQHILESTRANLVVAFQQLDRKFALRAAGRAGIPCLISAQNQHHFWGPRPLPLLKRYAYASLLRRHAAMVACTSEVVRREVVEDFGVAPQRTALIPNGIRPVRCDESLRETVRNQLLIASRQVVAINVGRLDVQKGQDVLIDALGQLPDQQKHDLRMLLVGDRPDTRNRSRMSAFAASLVEKVRSHGLDSTVVFMGWRDDVPRLLNSADLYVHASRWEGPALPVAVLEAMGAGLPVILTDCSGMPDGFRNGEHGYVVSAGSPAALADALESVLDMTPEQRQRMGSAAQELQARCYDLDSLAAEFVELADSLASAQSTDERRARPADDRAMRNKAALSRRS